MEHNRSEQGIFRISILPAHSHAKYRDELRPGTPNEKIQGFIRKDSQREFNYLFFEQVSNILFRDVFLPADQAMDLGMQVETNSHHGFPHSRRLEKFLKQIHKQDVHLRHDDEYNKFVFSQFLSLRFHDLFEIPSGLKKNHSAAAALLTAAFLSDKKEFIEQRIRVENPGDFEIPAWSDEEWRKMVYGTAVMCLHHSNPERFVDEAEKVKEGTPSSTLLPLRDIVHTLDDAASREGVSIEDIFPPFSIPGLKERIQAIREGSFVLEPSFDPKETVGMSKAVQIFAAIDKLDSIHPPELSTNRTFLTMPDRELFLPLHQFMERGKEINGKAVDRIIAKMKDDLPQFHPVIDSFIASLEAGKIDEWHREESISRIATRLEYELRIRFADSFRSPDDFSRLLFEMQRVEFTGLSGWLTEAFRQGIRGKVRFVKQAINSMIDGDFTPLTAVYDKIGTAAAPSRTAMVDFAGQEKKELERALQHKHNLLLPHLDNPGLAAHLQNLVQVGEAQTNLPPSLPFSFSGLPYKNYFPK